MLNALQTATTFFGWLTVVNIGIYLFTVIALATMRNFAYQTSAKIFGVDVEEVAKTTFKYVGAYKLLITVFCLTPWLALKLMS